MFQEPNLSIRYLGQEEFRLTYKAALFYPTIIVLTPRKIVVKHETKGLPYFPENENLLDSLELFHYRKSAAFKAAIPTNLSNPRLATYKYKLPSITITDDPLIHIPSVTTLTCIVES